MTYFTRSSRATYSLIDPGPEPLFEEHSQDSDVEMTIEDEDQGPSQDEAEAHDPVNNIEDDRIIVAIDFGTTFSSVAYATLERGVSPEDVDIRNVKCIGNYPGYEPPLGVLDVRYEVPTELWYDYGQMERPACSSAFTDHQDCHSEAETVSSSDEDEENNGTSQNNHTQPYDDGDGFERVPNKQDQKTKLTRATQYWGYRVQQQLNSKNISKDDARPLTKFKLSLEQKSETNNIRTEVSTTLNILIGNNVIRNDTDIYAHYLTHLLKHTKEQLLLTNDFHSDMLIHFVLCVPAKWPMRACRIMQTAMETAVVEAGLGGRCESSLHNIFMISEPEAAAECILAEARSELFVSKIYSDRFNLTNSDAKHNESVVVIDAGGGTVDAVTYKCEMGDPLRLAEEAVAPDSA